MIWSAARLAGIATPVLFLALASCGRPSTGHSSPSRASNADNDNAGGDDDDDDGTDNPCENNSDCPTGTCDQDTGLCVSPDDCLEDTDCGNNQYCEYVDADSPWVSGTTGECALPCASQDDCRGFGQDCINGQCYTLSACDPENNSADCPPGEVCNDQSEWCTAPPAQCTWPEDCPVGWICNIDNTCMDPDDVSAGGCETQADCDGLAGCQNGACTCEGGECRPECTTYEDCAADFYCALGACVEARECANQGECTPYDQICVDGACVEAAPCGAGGSCPTGETCNENATPPGCFPDNTNECVRDDQCDAGEYCELFTGTCETGCRNNADCAGQCAGSTCSCDSAHDCVDGSVGGGGDECGENADCGGGLACAFNDPMMASFCGFGDIGIPGMDCDKGCRVVCDSLVNLIINTCPNGEVCGGGDPDDPLGNAIMAMINLLFGSLMSSESVSVCYPPP